MPKKSKSKQEMDEDYVEDTDLEHDSDVEDYVTGFGGKTRRQAVSGEGKFNFTSAEKTQMFRHAIRHRYCSNYPPTGPIFIDLIRQLISPLQGLRYTKACTEALVNWINNNVSSAMLGELFMMRCQGRFGTVSVYSIAIASSLVAAVEESDFTFDDILALRDPYNPITDHHVKGGRQFVEFGASVDVVSEHSWASLVREAVSELARTGSISRPSNASPAYPAYQSSSSASHNVACTQVVPVSVYSDQAQPLYPTDRKNLDHKMFCWNVWRKWVTDGIMAHARKSNLVQAMPGNLKAEIAWNGGSPDFNVEVDYVDWYIKHNESKNGVV
ncbi:hypothetical protein AC578_4032 [Pseudocercospora eumusae]|uniref:Uncharacterized protein n=1 Tax=Pseudocercospora eumusae TaxID=321146 RepID=A0A139HDX9_9PEZI|nr:hypothetical protein AC578_4032 [Pseudocercospora eumusae]